MKKRAEEIQRQQRDARAKKLLLALVPLLLILGLVMGPKMLKQLRGSEAAAPAATTETGAAPGTVDVGAGSPATAAPGAAAPETASGAPTGASLAAQSTLPPTDVPPPPGDGDLVTFSRFDARDPFVQLVVEAGSDAAASDGTASASDSSGSTVDASGQTTTTAASSGGTSGGDTTTDTSGGDATAGDQVTIEVNGQATVVRVGETFPASDPAFKLVAIENGVAKIGLASGSFSDGMETLSLEIGQTVTLISQPDGARFQLKLVKVG